MTLNECYRVLGVRPGASAEDIKAAYRRLARQLHPDASQSQGSGHPHPAQITEQFIRVTTAYKHLIAHTSKTPPKAAYPPQPQPTPKPSAPLSPEVQLKQQTFQRLRELFRQGRFPSAIALVEGLGQRFPEDLEIRQWQAITYQQWGSRLIQQQQIEQGTRYLQKALRTDPKNRSLQAVITQELQRLQSQPMPTQTRPKPGLSH